ncbi:beta-galactosidase [Nonomuraea rhizosphaerae]|uniref:beta-galactosidase n=1 Tax=Nonomuraea rhizosphaerae TaxID=2665663 RepID=UPI001C605DFA|nr:beta-galactosidase [Nonomuraea rhizosphaerae]
MTVRLSSRRILVDGEPALVMSGEVHYFRLAAKDWPDRLDRLMEAGCTAVSSYMPWLVHELPDGRADLTGRTSEQRDLTGFLDLAAERGLLVIARPGPFVMAELKNEGIPYRVYDEHPHVHPTSWDGAPAPTRTIDYLAPDFLGEVARWYAAIMPVLAERLVTRGGPVAAVQLDNEIGMLSWISNSPDLTEVTLADLERWSGGRWSARDVRNPSLAFQHDLGRHNRSRYARYIAFLREEAEKHGVRDVPFLINLHGTSDGRGRTYPIGISQLYQGVRGQSQLTSGSDHYLGDLTVTNVADLYVGNAFMAAVHDADQPLTSLEFEAGGGDYGEDLSRQVPPSAVELKTRLCLAQGNRLINYYLFAGGFNPPLDLPVADGNSRIAFTGERHGFAAPVSPEGAVGPPYEALRAVVTAARGVAPLLADMDEEHDGLALAFVPDHYLTEYAYPGDRERAEVVADLERFRGMGARDVPARALLLAGFSFPAVDVQEGTLDPARALVLASASTLAAEVQERVAAFVLGGGRLLLAGVLPHRDVDGTRCTVLADALGLSAGPLVNGTPDHFPSVRAEGEPEVRVGVMQHLSHGGGSHGDGSHAGGEVIVRDVATGEAAGVEVRAGAGQAIVLTCDYPCHLPFWTGLLARLGVRPRHTHDAPQPGIVVTSTADASGRRLLHLLNLAPFPQSLVVRRDGVALFDGRRIDLPARSGLMLPEGVGAIVWATCEPVGTYALRRRGRGDAAAVESDGEVSAEGATVTRDGSRWLLTWPDDPAAAGRTVRVLQK